MHAGFMKTLLRCAQLLMFVQARSPSYEGCVVSLVQRYVLIKEVPLWIELEVRGCDEVLTCVPFIFVVL